MTKKSQPQLTVLCDGPIQSTANPPIAQLRRKHAQSVVARGHQWVVAGARNTRCD
jgi:hypothetical protein